MCGVTISFPGARTSVPAPGGEAGSVPWIWLPPSSARLGDIAHTPQPAAAEHQRIAHFGDAAANGARRLAEGGIGAEGGTAKHADGGAGLLIQPCPCRQQGCATTRIFLNRGIPRRVRPSRQWRNDAALAFDSGGGCPDCHDCGICHIRRRQYGALAHGPADRRGSGAPSFRPLLALMPYLWPKNTGLRMRVFVSLLCMTLGIVATTYFPLLMGQLTDQLAVKPATAIAMGLTLGLVGAYVVARVLMQWLCPVARRRVLPRCCTRPCAWSRCRPSPMSTPCRCAFIWSARPADCRG